MLLCIWSGGLLAYGNSCLENVCVCGVLRCVAIYRGTAVLRGMCVWTHSSCLFLVVRETPGACVCCCACQTKALLLSIRSERPRWCFPPSANKSPGHPACRGPPLTFFQPPIVYLTPLLSQLRKLQAFPPQLPLVFSSGISSVFTFVVQWVHLSSKGFLPFCHFLLCKFAKFLIFMVGA